MSKRTGEAMTIDPEAVERISTAMSKKRAELQHLPLARIYRELFEAGMESYLGEHSVVVPRSALLWLFGEAPSAQGKWFSDDKDEVKPVAGYTPKYWWRPKFRELAGLASSTKSREKDRG